jgi:hypothetical protein
MHRTQLNENKKDFSFCRKDFSVFLSFSLWEEMWVEIQTAQIAEQYQ